MNQEQYIEYLKQGDALLSAGNWEGAFLHFEQMYLRFGSEPNVLFGMGLSAAKRGEYPRAARLIADACLRHFVPEWLVWLAFAYDKLNFVLAEYVVLYYLIEKEGRTGDFLLSMYQRSKERMRDEFVKRALPAPDFKKPPPIVKGAQEVQKEIARLLKSERNAEALTKATEALKRYPDNTYILQNAGLAEKRHLRYEKSLEYYLKSFVLDPLDDGIITNIGNLLVVAQAPQEAMILLEAGAMIRRDDGFLWGNLAVAYNAMRVTPWEGEFAARRAIELIPQNATHWGALSSALSRQGRMAESLIAWEEVVKREPAKEFDNLFQIQYAEHLSSDEIAAHHRKYGELASGKVSAMEYRPTDRPKRQKIRLGWVSGDLKSHPVAYFVEPLLTHLDRSRFELYLYQTSREDQVSKRFMQYGDRWLNVEKMDDEALAAQLRSDAIDILWDLSGHTAHNRLLVFARRCAPLQLTWLGHPNTTGLKTMDWRITDAYADPPGTDYRYTEKLIRLTTHAAYAPLVTKPEMRTSQEYAVNPTPALQSGMITWGCCNNLSKISDTAVRLWSEIMLKVPNSRLLLEAPGLHQREFCRSVIARFEKHGVEPERLLMSSRMNEMQYKRYHEIDIALDPFPYNGGTTTCDLLWMGVPLVSLAGDACVSRLGVSFLNNIGRPEWIAETHDQYVKIAVDLASDIQRLNEIRTQQRARVEKSPLMDGAAFAREVESAMGDIWQDYVSHGADEKGKQ